VRTREPIADRRLWNQGVTRTGPRRPEAVVRWQGAVQAQEFGPARWALGLRLHGRALDADVLEAFDSGRILRTHVLRPTWHFVCREDIRWLLALTGPAIQRRMLPYNRHLELDARTFRRALGIIERTLGEGRHRTRKDLRAALEDEGFRLNVQRLAHIVMEAELEGLVCSGPLSGGQFTYALVAERAPDAPRLPRDEALATLAARYFRSHGPATIRDFVWWSGVSTADAKRAVEMVRAGREEVEGLTYWTLGPAPRGTARPHAVHLLPIYDEYLIAYRDRVAVPHVPGVAGSGWRAAVTFQHPLIVDGQVRGTWRVGRGRDRLAVQVTPIGRLPRSARGALAEAASRYERFVGATVDLQVS
jgi:hypothetical protein